MQPDDAQWRRPSDVNPGSAPGGPQPAGPPGPPSAGPPGAPHPVPPGATGHSPDAPYPGLSYHGPPPMTPPPSGWHPPRVFRPADPRRLPAQNHARMDEAEARAHTMTQGVGIVVGAILVIALCALCARLVF